MTNKKVNGIISWLKGWFYDKEEVNNELATKVDKEINKALFPSSAYAITSNTPFTMFTGQGQYTNLYDFLIYLNDNAGSLSSTYAPKYHASNVSATAGLYGKASTSNWGHVKLDSTPIRNSTNAVTSGGLWTALADKSDDGHTHTSDDSSFSPSTVWGDAQGITNITQALNELREILEENLGVTTTISSPSLSEVNSGNVTFVKHGKTVILTYNINFKSQSTANVTKTICNIPTNYTPNDSIYSNFASHVSDFSNTGGKGGIAKIQKNSNGVWQFMMSTPFTGSSMVLRGQMMWFSD